MAQKFNSKNFSYDAKPPPFLATLQAQVAGHAGPDPITSARRRPGKKRSDSEEAEDAPLVVDENGNAVGVQVDKDGVVTEAPSKPGDAGTKDTDAATKDGATTTTGAEKRETDAKASIGGRKRKGGRVIGGGDEEEAAEEAAPEKSASKKKDAGEDKAGETKSGDKKPKKKVRKIKLSFDED